jgi:hypothetical protein
MHPLPGDLLLVWPNSTGLLSLRVAAILGTVLAMDPTVEEACKCERAPTGDQVRRNSHDQKNPGSDYFTRGRLACDIGIRAVCGGFLIAPIHTVGGSDQLWLE